MSLNDESLLSAYLDGELDEPTRSRVESAVGSDPRLARKLREMGEVRDLIGALSRPGSSEWTCDRVMASIAAEDARRPIWMRRPARLFALGVGLAAAAGIWGFLVLRPLAGPERGRGGETADLDSGPAVERGEPETPPVVANVAPTLRVEPAAEPTSRPSLPVEGVVAGSDFEAPPASLVAAEEADPTLEARLRAFEHEVAGLPEVAQLVVDLPESGADTVRSLEQVVATMPRLDPRYIRSDHPAVDGGKRHILFVFRADAVERRKLMEGLGQLFGRPLHPNARPDASAWTAALADHSLSSLREGVQAPPRVEMETSIFATKDMEDPMPAVSRRRPEPAGASSRPSPQPAVMMLRLPLSD